MIETVFENLTSPQIALRVEAAVQVGSFALDLKSIDYQSKHDFERLCRQADTYPDWPESEQRRFRQLIQGVRSAAKKEGKLFDKNGSPIW